MSLFAVTLCQSLRLFTAASPWGWGVSNQKREGRCGVDKSFFFFFLLLELQMWTGEPGHPAQDCA